MYPSALASWRNISSGSIGQSLRQGSGMLPSTRDVAYRSSVSAFSCASGGSVKQLSRSTRPSCVPLRTRPIPSPPPLAYAASASTNEAQVN